MNDQSDAEKDPLVTSPLPEHPSNLIPALCRTFYTLGWVTGTGGGAAIRHGGHIYLAPSGVQKELIKPSDLFVMDYTTREYLRSPPDVEEEAGARGTVRRQLKASACTPLFMKAFEAGAGCAIHNHSQWAVLVTLLVEGDWKRLARKAKEGEGEYEVFEIELLEQVKGVPRGKGKEGALGYRDRLRVPIIDNTPFEEDLTDSLADAMQKFPDTYAILVKRHGVYVWGDTVAKAKTTAESLDYIFQLAVRMRELNMPWLPSEA